MKKITDGNTACSDIAYIFTELASIYPITPSSPMAANVDILVSKDKRNLFNNKVSVIEMQSEAGAAGAMHGALLTGTLATTFTSSQGLLLMLPNMYKMAGELLPGVIHVASRSVATHALSIFGDHQDIYAARGTGFSILASTNVFDAQNLAAVAHLSAIEGSIPFIHFFDGFRTSHEVNTIDAIDENELLKLIDYDKITTFKERMLNLNSKKQYGMAQNEDIYFQVMESRNTEYLNMPDIVKSNMDKINNLMGTNYKPFNYYGSSNAKYIIVAMGSVCDTIKNYIKDRKDLGLIEVHLYRPFSKKYLLDVLPNTVEKIAVLDRTKEAGSSAEPLYLDILSALNKKNIDIVGGRYGLSSKNISPKDIASVYNMLKTNLKDNFTIGIYDDVTDLSLEEVEYREIEKTYNIKIYGFGSDGMVGASKSLLSLIHKKEGLYTQGYFEYDSKKSGGITVSNLRLSKDAINMPYYITNSNLVVVTKDEYFTNLDIVDDLNDNRMLLINTYKTDTELKEFIPNNVLNKLKEKNIRVFYINASKIAQDNNLKEKISKIMEYIITILLSKDYKEDIIESVKAIFKSKGEDIINNNIKALMSAPNDLKKLELTEDYKTDEERYESLFDLIRNRKGGSIKVSELLEFKDGNFPSALTKEEKRNIATHVPKWIPENCIQCGQCSFVCPHAVIRPIVDQEEGGIPLAGHPDFKYKIEVSTEDCTSCGLCIEICPGKGGKKALEMTPNTTKVDVRDKFENHINPDLINKFTIKGSQLQKPLFEFSGACAGCGETAYIKLLTQLYGKNIIIANATGCSSIYGGSTPSTPYYIPWANSLFEDNAEFALGMHYSQKIKRDRVKHIVEESINSVDTDIKEIFTELLDNFYDDDITLAIKDKLKDKLIPKELKELIEDIPSRTIWSIGGDGWAYDIGYGGLDHVLHTGENIKFLVLDTEVYSNTGGQASKATKTGAKAQFANDGKKTSKKDLFRLAMSIPNCYVASISLGANLNHTLRVFKAAKEHNGPAIIIAYSPCIEHGVKGGLTCSLSSQKLGVESGYLLLMRYDGANLYIDSSKPDFEKYFDYLKNENRFSALLRTNEEEAMKLFNIQKENAINRYSYYEKQKNIDN